MHRALLITEILEHIFACLNEGFDRLEGAKNGGTLSALARTCRAFNESALDALWENVASLDAFVKCLPSNAWKINDDPFIAIETDVPQSKSTVTYTRPLTPEDWEIIKKNAPRVRRFYHISNGWDSSDILWELGLAPRDMHPLLPSLKHLEWQIRSDGDRSHIRMFLSPSLESLRYEAHPRWGKKRDASILANIGIWCPRLKIAHIGFGSNVKGGTAAFSRSVVCWNHLTSLRCSELTDEALLHIARLPTLQDLCVGLTTDNAFADIRSRLTTAPFPSLTHVEVCSVNFAAFIAFATEMSLSLVDVTLLASDNLCSQAMEEVFRVLANGNRQMTRIRILEHGGEVPIPKDYDFEIRGRTMTIETFRPLFKFGQLRTLDVTVMCNLLLSDLEIIELARAFPLLENLSLNAEYGWAMNSEGPTSLVTLYGLLSVLSLCRRLRFLGLEISAETTEELLPPPEGLRHAIYAGMPVNRFIRTLRVGNAKINEPEAVARLLFAVMPKLYRIVAWSSKYSREYEDDAEEWEQDLVRYRKRWSRTEVIVSRLRLGLPVNVDDEESSEDEEMGTDVDLSDSEGESDSSEGDDMQESGDEDESDVSEDDDMVGSEDEDDIMESDDEDLNADEG
ncbi:hypothetical protein CONPUDRAFT_164571 [Coniophora puteana RWD-64-598 SS2]|uniref:F-box domain-containing protein n=1 Tax=Coniophora puteana (strain RWD-64-598) TaxID=741705 RepID=A0A5M3MST9_CONPW|nr:uncharacterized protein CONPUDRAFT_164571 [Coniophora puteana RWD-64-598 SS2]EIW81804.1 hypothetical protein CONPUDRAFT_164571 [Coniophora puteana RWD-64-598 SS2]